MILEESVHQAHVFDSLKDDLLTESMHFASSKDNKPVMAAISYYGVIEEIWEVDYVKFRVPVFKCKWVDI